MEKHLVFALVTLGVGFTLLWFGEYKDGSWGKKMPPWSRILIYVFCCCIAVVIYIWP